MMSHDSANVMEQLQAENAELRAENAHLRERRQALVAALADLVTHVVSLLPLLEAIDNLPDPPARRRSRSTKRCP